MTASFTLAVDVGTSRTAAAIARRASGGTITTESVRLGRRTDTAPSIVFAADGETLFGDAAERRGIWQPERVIRDVKRRIGDGVPILVGDERFSPEKLYAATVAWVIEAVVEREGDAPAAVSVTIPVTWGAHRIALVQAALGREGWDDVELITEPEAAARHYESVHPLAGDGVIGVYDLGGGTFDAAIMQKDAGGGFDVIGEPLGLDDFGGADLDDLVFRHALAAADISPDDLGTGEGVRLGLSALRRDCTDAKESLSFDSEAVVPLLMGTHRTTVRIVRSEFESMIESGIARTIAVFRDALARADVTPSALDAILLTGGSSRIPRVAQLLSEEFDRPTMIDSDPKATVSRGAALVAARRHLIARPALEDEAMDAVATTGTPPARFPTDRVPRRSRSRAVGPALAVAAGALVLVAGIGVTIGLESSDPTDPAIEPAPRASSLSKVSPVTADSLELGLRERIAAREPSPSETPLLSPAPESDRIRNLQDPLASAPPVVGDAP